MIPLRSLSLVAVACAALAFARPASADPAAPGAAVQTAPADAPPSWLAQPARTEAAVAAPPASGSRLRTWGALFLVVALGGVALWARRNKGLARVKESTTLKVVDTARVGPKAHLVVARCGEKTFLLGVTETSIRRLSWLPEVARDVAEEPKAAQPAETAATQAPAKGPEVRSFAQLMRQLVHPNVVIQERAEELIAKKDSVPPPPARSRDDVTDAYLSARARGPARDTFEPSRALRPSEAPRVSMAVPKGRRPGPLSEAPSQAAGLMSLRAKRG